MKTIIYPKLINRSSTIGIYTPSEPLNDSRQARVRKNVEFLRGEGYAIIEGECFNGKMYYTSGTPTERATEINRLVENPNVDILISSWGGKSCSHVLQHLDYSLISKQRKPIATFSDSTLLANAIFSKTGLITFVGPNVVGKLDESEFSDLIFFKSETAGLSILTQNDRITVLKKGKSKGRLLGGNLSSFILGLIGTEYFPDIKDGIFIFEMGSSTPQLLDQYLSLLENSGFLNSLNGIVVGSLEECKDQKDWGGRSPIDVILERTKRYSIPILQTEEFGHGKRRNPIFPIGALCEIDGDNGQLTILENIFENGTSIS